MNKPVFDPERASDAMAADGIDVILATTRTNVSYLAGYYCHHIARHGALREWNHVAFGPEGAHNLRPTDLRIEPVLSLSFRSWAMVWGVTCMSRPISVRPATGSLNPA